MSTGQKLQKQAEEKAAFEAAQAIKRAEQDIAREAEIKEVVTSVGEDMPEDKKDPKVETTYTLSFKATGTQDQLMKLSEFAKTNGLKLEKI
ncbi:MAG: hypothetical protein Q4E09_06080 [Eubacteriales bacterium]|nr:hypothetical protein [Eubacteriales bacterium]